MSDTLLPTGQNSDGSLKPEPPAANDSPGADQAVDLIRQKINALYAQQPNHPQPAEEERPPDKPLSKHQQFMRNLQASGKNLAEIQTAWHNYYVGLPDEQKHQVWQEFYDAAKSSRYGQLMSQQSQHEPNGPTEPELRAPIVSVHEPELHARLDRRPAARIKRDILSHVENPGKLPGKHHLKSLGFGLAMGLIVVIIFLFGFFNEVIIAPFIQPSRNPSSAPLIISSSTVSASAVPEIIIPKINVEIPVVYSIKTDAESAIEDGLEYGVVHYPSTVLPGQDGNAAFFGHSSNNIFNPGKYKFAFVLLHELVNGDTFYLTYQGKIYVYEVIAHRIVPPSDVAVLNDTLGQKATATLITCDPPGTSLNRLVVTGKQISPNPSTNFKPAPASNSLPVTLASNGPSLWSRFINWLF